MAEEIEVYSEKSLEYLNSVKINWSYEATALAGIGFAILALAETISKLNTNKN